MGEICAMTKRLRENRDDMEIEAIKQHLDKQDKDLQVLRNNDTILENSMKEILGLLKGSFITDSKGLIQNMKEMRESSDKIVKDVGVLYSWKKTLEDSKGTLTIRFSILFTRVLAIVGGIGTIVAVALGIKELLGK